MVPGPAGNEHPRGPGELKRNDSMDVGCCRDLAVAPVFARMPLPRLRFTIEGPGGGPPQHAQALGHASNEVPLNMTPVVMKAR